MCGITLLIVFKLPRGESYWPSFLLNNTANCYSTSINDYFKRRVKVQQLQHMCTCENGLQFLKALLLFLAPNYLLIFLQQLGYGCCYFCISFDEYTIQACDFQKSSNFFDILELGPIYYILNFSQVDCNAFLGYYETQIFHFSCKEGAFAQACIELVLP